MIRRISPNLVLRLQTIWFEFIESPRAAHYLIGSDVSSTFKVSDSDWAEVQRVSMDGDEIVGFFAARIDRDTRGVSNLSVVNFRPGNLLFARDLERFTKSLVEQFSVVRFSCVAGSPNELIYQRAVERFGGSFVGRAQRYYRLQNGRLADAVFFEFLGKGAETHSSGFSLHEDMIGTSATRTSTGIQQT